jgi:hypothetical protein
MVQSLSRIQQSNRVTTADLKVYERLSGSPPQIKDLSYSYHNSPHLVAPDTCFIYIKGSFYPLPKTEKADDLAFILIDQLIYELQRHKWEDVFCVTLRLMIKRFLGELYIDNPKDLSRILSERETASHTYFGQYISDDSDSECEAQFQALPKDERDKKITRSKENLKKFGERKYRQRIQKCHDDSPTKSPIAQPGIKHFEIPREEDFQRREVRLIHEAESAAHRSGKILIYRDEDGGFSLTPPVAPSTANKRLAPEIMAERALLKKLTDNLGTVGIQSLSEIKFNERVTNWEQQDGVERLRLRLFGVKDKFNPENRDHIPVVTKLTV